MKIPPSRLSRRNFLVAVGVGGTTAAVALVAGKDGVSPAPPAKTSGDGQGYRVTEHIRNYYRTAKV